MTLATFQAWLNARGASLEVDGMGGPKTRAAILDVFTNLHAPAVLDDELQEFADKLGASLKQIKAVALVESSGGGFTDTGRPKILFERHYFWRLTGGRFGASAWSQPTGGGYDGDSWSKLCLAACQDPAAAFGSCSWGKFQIMGAHWKALGYPTVLDFVWELSRTEAAHYDAFARFIEANNLTMALRRIDGNPANCLAFARGYNGKGQRGYDGRIAAAWRTSA
jgi:hypothetical protein